MAHTMSNARTLLLIDGDPSHEIVFREALLEASDGPFHGEWVKTLREAIDRLQTKDIWAIFLNLSLPDSQGLNTFDKLMLAAPDVPILVLAGGQDQAIALEGLRRGAKDFILEDHLDCYSLVRAIRNMAERRAVEQTLFVEKERAQVTLNSIGDAVLSTDIDAQITYLNVVAEKMTGWTLQEAMGRPVTDIFRIIDGNSREPSPDPLQAAIEQNKTVALTPNCILIRRDGFESAIEDSAAPIHDRSGLVTGAVIVFHDVSEARAMGLAMSRQAQHDVLTNLPNRMLLKDRLGQAIEASHRNGTRAAVLYLDLDEFKHINDTFTHAIGDKLLQAIAKRLLACVRHADTVSRQGGDEFVVLLSEIAHAQDAGATATKIVKALSAPYDIDQHSLRITASIGMATYPDDGEDAEILIKNADIAMYQAKKKGRNNCQFFDRNMNVVAMERELIREGLRTALERDEFVLFYQPKVDLKTEQITGVEALVRWTHPERGLIKPPQFISIAEDSGLILPIGRWVLREACRQARAWQDAGLRPIGLAVNISSVEFRSVDVLEGIQRILQETRLSPHYLELELTESALMRHVEFTIPVLRKLKALGIRLAIDDFGTGYSSLSYLRQFPIDSLKMDQSFVHEIDANTGDAAIINAVIDMGKILKHRVTAEGVETAGQLAFLKANGCDDAQGYYFSPPVTAAQFANLLESGMSLPAMLASIGGATQGLTRTEST